MVMVFGEIPLEPPLVCITAGKTWRVQEYKGEEFTER